MGGGRRGVRGNGARFNFPIRASKKLVLRTQYVIYLFRCSLCASVRSHSFTWGCAFPPRKTIEEGGKLALKVHDPLPRHVVVCERNSTFVGREPFAYPYRWERGGGYFVPSYSYMVQVSPRL